MIFCEKYKHSTYQDDAWIPPVAATCLSGIVGQDGGERSAI